MGWILCVETCCESCGPAMQDGVLESGDVRLIFHTTRTDTSMNKCQANEQKHEENPVLYGNHPHVFTGKEKPDYFLAARRVLSSISSRINSPLETACRPK